MMRGLMGARTSSNLLGGFMKKERLVVWAGALLATIGVGYLIGNYFPYKTSKVVINELPPNTAWQEGFANVSKLDQWRIENYNNPIVQSDGSKLVITGEGKPAGLFFRSLLNSKQKYQVDIAGSPLDGSINLRVRLNEREPYWVAAPSGAANFVISDTGKVELLIYADGKFSYELSKLTIAASQN